MSNFKSLKIRFTKPLEFRDGHMELLKESIIENSGTPAVAKEKKVQYLSIGVIPGYELLKGE